jgi:hypothetical protein
MTEREAWAKLRPSGNHDRHELLILAGYLAFVAILIAAIFYLKHRHHEDMENNWMSEIALIEDVRPQQVGLVDTPMSGAILYRVDVLVRYKSDSKDQERWITVDQKPESLEAARLQMFRWKGQQCIVRWKPSDPNKVIAEVS